MRKFKDILIYCTSGVLLKWLITFLTFSHVGWLLFPVKQCVEMSTGQPSLNTGQAYLFPNQVLLSIECSGVHFFTISFLSFWIICAQRFSHFKSILIAIVVAYCVTIIANTLRILFFLSDGLSIIEQVVPKNITHQLLGGVIFCFWLIAVSFFLNQKINNQYEVV